MTVPNPHVITIVADYNEPDLIDAGKRADEVFPEGANVSFLLPLPRTAPRPRSSSAPLSAARASPRPAAPAW